MFSEVDILAVAVGAVCGAYAQIVGPKQSADGANALLGFFAGVAASYLLVMAYALWRDVDLLNRMMRTNPITVFAAFVYGGYINIRALPGLKAKDGRRIWRED